MIYPLLAISLIAIAVFTDFFLHTNVLKQKTTWLVMVIMLGLTLIFDTVLVTLPIVTYTPTTLSGIFISHIPIEDFSYTLFIVIFTLSLKKYYERIS